MVYEYSVYTKWKVPAQDVGEEFERIETEQGELNKENVLDSARPVDAVLHPLFEWNDAIAGEKYRLHQAGRLIQAIVKIDDTPHEEPIRAFVQVNNGKEKGKYYNIERAMTNSETRDIVLNNAKKELIMFRRKYNNFKEFAAVFKAMDDSGIS